MGTRAEQYTDTGKDHQRWRLKPAGPGSDGFYNIENVHSLVSLEVVGYSKEPGAYSKEPGAEIVQRPYDSGPLHRQWKLVPVTGKTDVYKIENRNSGLVLDDVDGRKGAPAPVKQYESWNDDGRQQWKLIPVPARKVALVNGGFEQPTVTHSNGWELFPDASQTHQPNRVPGWLTTATDHLIEIWKSGAWGVVSDEGAQHVELNANMVSTLARRFGLGPRGVWGTSITIDDDEGWTTAAVFTDERSAHRLP